MMLYRLQITDTPHFWNTGRSSGRLNSFNINLAQHNSKQVKGCLVQVFATRSWGYKLKYPGEI